MIFRTRTRALATAAAVAGAPAGTPPPPPVDAAALQRVLEHDNFQTRSRMKRLMEDPLFVP